MQGAVCVVIRSHSHDHRATCARHTVKHTVLLLYREGAVVMGPMQYQ